MRKLRIWLITFVGSSLLSIAVVLLALWWMTGFQGLGIGLEGTIAVALGVTVTIGLGVGLMALVFLSDRSARDEEVHHSQSKPR